MSQAVISSLTPLFTQWWSVVGAIAAGMALFAYMADRDPRICILLQALPGFAIQSFITLIPIANINHLNRFNSISFLAAFVVGMFCGVNFYNFILFIFYALSFTIKHRRDHRWTVWNRTNLMLSLLSYPITQLLFNFLPKSDL